MLRVLLVAGLTAMFVLMIDFPRGQDEGYRKGVKNCRMSVRYTSWPLVPSQKKTRTEENNFVP